jgi:hypothetical protein
MTSMKHYVQLRMGASTLSEGHTGGWHCHWSVTTCYWVTMPRDIVRAMPAVMIRPHRARGVMVALRMEMPLGSVDDLLLSHMPAFMIRPHCANGTVVTLRMAMPLGSVDDMLMGHQCRAIKGELSQPFRNDVGKLQRNSSGFVPPSCRQQSPCRSYRTSPCKSLVRLVNLL